ncbi:peroxisomal membrane protein PEX14 [Iris pallida]|uniref:Peroxisomal membrane protein PEX14 n=1 Tax=Iris pallida TaxID=29817 RepID=A0AAX6HC64_IRIPA|nr:peroxisomal membrane protein PEX14 [Iris pallida]
MSTPSSPDGNPKAPVDENSQDVKAEAVNDTSDRPFSVPSQPLREDQVQNAVNFLSHPRVKGSPVIYRRSFLEKKGLTREEIDEAFRRVPDPPSNATTVEAATTNQAIQPKSSTSVQAQAPIQTPQTAAAPVSIASVVPSSQQYKFQWSHALIAVGVLAASGAGSAVFFKNVVVPRLKTWIRKVVAEKNESEEEDKPGSVLAEQTAEAAKAAATAAAAAAAIAAKASEDLLNSKTEEKKYFEAFMGMMDVQLKEMKTMGETIRKLESTKENSSYQDKLIQEYIQSTIGNGNNSWGTSQQEKVNGTPNADNGAVRPSSAPVNAEPTTAPHPKSYMEIMAMVQRGEKPPNVRDIDDMPPNPNQQIAKPLLAPRPKPWEVPQQKPSYSLQSQPSAESLGSESLENGLSSHSNGKAGNVEDASEPWWRKKTVKITEIEPEAEETRQQQPQKFPYNIGGADGRPSQRGWVPPQPPTVAIPESAAAIRQPKSSSIQKQASSEMTPSDSREEAAASSSAPQDLGVEPEASGSAVTESNISEIEEEREGGVEVY